MIGLMPLHPVTAGVHGNYCIGTEPSYQSADFFTKFLLRNIFQHPIIISETNESIRCRCYSHFSACFFYLSIWLWHPELSGLWCLSALSHSAGGLISADLSK